MNWRKKCIILTPKEYWNLQRRMQIFTQRLHLKKLNDESQSAIKEKVTAQLQIHNLELQVEQVNFNQY